MRNEHNQSLGVVLENGIDIVLNFCAMLMGYMFAASIIHPKLLQPNSSEMLITSFAVVIIQSLVFAAFNVYRPIPFVRTSNVLRQIAKVNIAYFLLVELVIIGIFVDEDKNLAMLWILFAFIISTAMLEFKKRMMIRFAKFFRKKGYNLRKVIIIGNNIAATEEFIKSVSSDSKSGMMVIGYVGDKTEEEIGCTKLGDFSELARILDEYHPSEVVFAIDTYNKRRLINLVNLCDDRCIKVYFLPVIYGFFKNARQIEQVGSLPVINVHSTPLDNRLNAFVKRVIDIFGSLALIIVSAPIMIVAAIGVYISSPGPIFFKQERVGRMGKPFTMLKFRSMKVNVQSDVGWTTGNDPRKTRFGTFLRRTAIDELPQLFNVLVGSMSLVGPRPELPYFVEQFKEIIPLYMVKHYVKPGLTGLAQVLGLRGDTSVEDRIHADIEYIENWSLSMDISILFKTPFKAINKQEKYVSDKAEQTETATAEQAQGDTMDKDNTELLSPSAANEADTVAEDVSAEKVEGVGEGKTVLYAASVMSHIKNFHLQYIERLRAEGYKVRIMARGEGADYNVPFEKKFFSSSNKACRAEIRKIFEREKYDAVVLNTSLAAFHIRFAMPKQNRPKVINIVHGYLFSRNTGFIKRCMLLAVEKLVAGRTDDIIVMNNDDKRIAEKHKLCIGDVIVSKGMGAAVRPPMCSTEKLRRELLCEDKYVLAFVGELSSRKNQAFLINAMNDIKEHIPNAVLWLIGDGLERDRLMSLARDVDLSESVFFLGQREDACDLMRACDLYVSASMIEGMPFNIIEAMGCEKTVLASRIKGHTDLIEDGRTGFLYKYGSRAEFVEKIAGIYNGTLAVKSEDVLEKYREFANEKVFDETYRMIKGCLE